MSFMFDEFNIFLHTKICLLAVLLETTEQTSRPGMYDFPSQYPLSYDRDQNHSYFLGKLSFDREIPNWVSKVIQDCFGFALFCYVIGPETRATPSTSQIQN